MAVDYSGFIARFTGFGSVAQATVELYLTDAVADCPSTIWGGLADRAAYLLTAHRLALELRGPSGAPGAKTGETAGPVSVSYASVTTGAQAGESTQYGEEYARLLRRLGLMVQVV